MDNELDGVPILDDESVDDLFGGRIRVIQKRDGYRFSVDAILLAHFALQSRLKSGMRLIDLGTGSAVVPVILAAREPGLRLIGVEIQDALAARAERTVRLNGMADRIRIIRADFRALPRMLELEKVDRVTCNPPYRPVGSGRINTESERAIARHEFCTSIGNAIEAARLLLRSGGRALFIYPAVRTVDLLTRMQAGDLAPKRLRPVYPKPGGLGRLVMVEGAKGGGPGLEILPPLFIYGEGNNYSGEMAGIYAMLDEEKS